MPGARLAIFYNKAEAGEVKTWDDFFALADKGKKITMLDDLRETIGVALIKNGHSVNETDAEALKKAEAWLLERKDKISAFSYDIVSLVQAGDIAAAHWYVGATLYTIQEPDKLGFVIPEEGATMYQEDICVLKSAPNKDSAIAFMEFYMQPEIAALNTKQQVNGTANVPARDLLPPELKANPNTNPPAEVVIEAADLRGSRQRSAQIQSRLDQGPNGAVREPAALSLAVRSIGQGCDEGG